MLKTGAAFFFALLVSGALFAASSPFLVAVGETALPPSHSNPLAALDLFPAPALVTPRPDLRPLALIHAGPLVAPRLKNTDIADSFFSASLLSTAALNLADFLSTTACLKYPHLSEGNPFMKPFVKDTVVFAVVKGGLTVLSTIGTKSLYKRSKPLGWIVSMATNFALSYVVANNYRLLQQARAR